MRVKLMVGVVAMVMTTGCGAGEGSAEDDAAAQERIEANERVQSEIASADASQDAEIDRAREAQQEAHDVCEAGAQPLIDALGQIDSRLSIGLNYSDYADRLGDARVAYDDLGPELGEACLLDVGIPLEGALNRYIDVLNAWGNCIDDINCDFSVGATNRQAQSDWRKAGRSLEEATSGLEDLQPA